ncbi:PREDICTED: nuclear RNA export factor 1-like [Cyphomyrmex costatus]|uniref:Nuclear RNA export factor 1 n=1 Tax=Cyphomyrmex costatus TaxID=456900 RepID=A0A195CZW4_9HYME|nr:PREDICTED: nuclear RNA export factor 1-like [Cyphomyrmex costatus]KYN06147.1 Nuclear RNA export factor 1 [Cyphomyrmex costatus]
MSRMYKPWDNRNNRGNNNKAYFDHNNRGPIERDGKVGPIRHHVSFKIHKTNNQISRNLAFVNLDDISSTSDNNTRQMIINQKNRERGNRIWHNVSSRRNNQMPNFKGVQFQGLQGKKFKGDQSSSRMQPFFLKESNGYRINIPYGHKYERDFIINTLLNYLAPKVFVPIMYKKTGTDSYFYIDDHKTANALLNCDRKITMSNGFKLRVKVKPEFPFCNIDDEVKERVKQALAKRYRQDTKALNLSKFHLDSDLCSDYFYALSYPIMMMTVLDIMVEYIPNLEALNLEGNKLQNIERLSILTKKFVKLNILHMGDNKIKDICQLDAIKDLKLNELKLVGNPVCNKYKSQPNDYVRDVRKRFPRLLVLDGTELPRPIIFDVIDEDANIPQSQKMFAAVDAKVQEMAKQFLLLYFTIFDSENRQPLLDAYDENACFSMTISISNNNKLNGYHLENRNLFRINDPIRRQKFLKQGKLPVVSFISEIPRTRHLLNTLTMDISLATQTMMFITITGYVQLNTNKEESIYYFNRTFIIVSKDERYCIRNEQLHISQLPEAQLKQLQQQLNQLGNQQIQLEAPALSSIEVTNLIASELNDEMKQQMVLTLSQQTNMNLEWSLKCLQDTQWNYNNAVSVFILNREQIPSQAFTK